MGQNNSRLGTAKPIQSRLRERQFATNQLLVGGNHLASSLVDWLGADSSKFPDYHTSLEEAREVIPDISLYDAWVCWRAIMLFRDVVRPASEDYRVEPELSARVKSRVL